MKELSFWGLLTGSTLDEISNELRELHALEGEMSSVKAHIKMLQSPDMEVVKAAVKDLLKGSAGGLPVIEQVAFQFGAAHQNMPLVTACLRADVPCWVHGDAGSGKSTAAENAANLLNLPFGFISVAPTTTKSDLYGFIDAGGAYRATMFRKLFEGGGVFLIDEIDNGNPSVITVLNAALANGMCAFPDGNVKRSKNARIVAAANTIGRGADIRYVGRNALDATTLDRFAFVRMDIDENLEGALAGEPYDASKMTNIGAGGQVTVDDWFRFVKRVRHAVNELGIEHVVSPRATLNGSRLIHVGVGRTHLENMCIWKGIRPEDREKITAYVADHRGGDDA
ncbi:MAG: AAA family ATPase [Patescibacteria group bacterium]|nr:AAA family ATPase [Patescibacteria group bacterium]MDE1966307.1 AAA family ATPase [Patescibacteria group bacterium]